MFYFISLILASVAAVSSSGLRLANSLDDQLPPIARIGKAYNWTFSSKTFASCDSIEKYTTSKLPGWLQFDSSTRTFHGTPGENDVGVPDITVIAHGCGSSESSWFNIFTTSNPPPTLKIPITTQFTQSNPSLSSVYFLSSNSSLASNVPTLRVPARWSFSIGLESDTFTSARSVHYQVLQDDGSAIPEWMVFNKKTITLNGVTPPEDKEPTPGTVRLILHASDEEGYSAETLPFNVVVASHEVTVASALPTINVTADATFYIALSSPADFAGVFVDGLPIHPKNISTLSIDTTRYSKWLTYEPSNSTLIGKPTSEDLASKPFLPVTIVTSFNQSVQTNLSIEHVPSYFSSDVLPTFYPTDRTIRFDLTPHVSGDMKNDDVNVSASFDPTESGEYLSLNLFILSGLLPESVPRSYINVTFTAYSHLTHTTSHTSLPISLPAGIIKKEGYGEEPHGMSKALHKRYVLGLAISFGVVGGVCVLGGLLALFRRCAKVEDTAVDTESNMKAWSEKDKQWYGLSKRPSEEKVGYGWSEGGGSLQSPPVAASAMVVGPTTPQRGGPRYPNLGPSDSAQSPGMMRKQDFVARVKDTVRNASDKYRSRRVRQLDRRPFIGKPILLKHSTFNDNYTAARVSHDGSPASKSPTLIHFSDRLSRQNSRDSVSSNASVRTHAAEAVVTTAHKTTARSASIISTIPDANGRPRMKHFKSASRVPLPQMPLSSPSSSSSDGSAGFTRVHSQKARIEQFDDDDSESGGNTNQTSDDLAMGMRYVQALGANEAVNAAPSSMTMSTNVRSSYSSFGSTPEHDVNVVRTGEQFKLRVHLHSPSPAVSYRNRKLEVRLTSGGKLPAFVHVDLQSARIKGWVELHGIPSVTDAGEMEIGFYTLDEDMCMAKVLLTVTRRK